ncbi:MAG: L-lactate dehydrogenase [Amphiplicatus sp.]
MILANVDDYRRAARRRLPHFLFEYIDGGSYSETTLRRNLGDLQALSLRQSVLRDVSNLSLKTDLFGFEAALPIALAPLGLCGLFARRGETQAARAAQKAGVPFTLSTVGICSCEEVGAAASPFWLQLYLMRDRGFLRAMLARAKTAGASALLLTVDLPVTGKRYRDMRSGLRAGDPTANKLRRFFQVMMRPAWAVDVGLLGRPHVLGNLAPHVNSAARLENYAAWVAANFDPSVTWKDVEDIRALWDRPLIVKGVLTPEDARAAIAVGADGVVVSNHGGRQLDGARSSISALPRIADAIGERAVVMMDGGVRTGLDVLRALASGARGVLIGRAFAYGLAARGARGVGEVLSILEQEMRVAMMLTGCVSLKEVGRHILDA